jgi:hypothetical protein
MIGRESVGPLPDPGADADADTGTDVLTSLKTMLDIGDTFCWLRPLCTRCAAHPRRAGDSA